jgi:phosphatidylglycerol:prolipoprotein diacylglycerol transferase
VSSVPTSFHVGPLVFHLYGFGLAIAAYVGFLYARRRLQRTGFDVTPFTRYAVALVVSGLVGARLAHIATNWGYYSGHPVRWLELWQGGLASFGGLALAIPVGLYLQRRWWPGTSLARFSDALVPALIAAWALGRVLGPQFMVNGGGHLTHQWFGLSYHGQSGKRVPVPLIQGVEDGLLWLVLLGVEKRPLARHAGVVTGAGMIVWGLVRALDERLLLGQESHSGSIGVQIAGVVLAVGGALLIVLQLRRATNVESLVDPSVRDSPQPF